MLRNSEYESKEVQATKSSKIGGFSIDNNFLKFRHIQIIFLCIFTIDMFCLKIVFSFSAQLRRIDSLFPVYQLNQLFLMFRIKLEKNFNKFIVKNFKKFLCFFNNMAVWIFKMIYQPIQM
ncbi:transmembrane protein, putative (macronuclear) [Tetrahymena thermophila SB210]|uniref:Transmembrane protein, putative n=1 Tax=Tetrahymena thermophila (strain SB210) TaxID=312017 RepID=Q23ML4_TETTS|nr:transmembrane protein, putative [Tetrahymena thermophila SB210]EAR97752.2 transmembrane protein, putative [Tetrahymena thermophila SB210]|eukprot:XP_001017997.2 transmembrane protein, putative [Tetrahymena thermophila SB210]